MDGVDSCARCGFNRGEWNAQDAQRTLQHADGLFAMWSVDAPDDLSAQLDARRLDDIRAIETADELIDKVHHLWHSLVSIADVRRAAGDAVSPRHGHISQISSSRGGVPKTAIDTATIDVRGVEGDVQAARTHHGRPWQALCLWSQEVIDGLAADGHPIAAGCAGENVTVSGIDWSELRAGTIVDLGEVRCQLSAPAVPCAKNARWFIDGDISLMDHDLHPGASRWYASVTRTGQASAGDPVTVSPA